MKGKLAPRPKTKFNTKVALLALPLLALAAPAAAFCGFYVARADSKLFNKSSKVVLARDGNTTVITMASDYQGEPKEFALVVPVPTFIERNQIGVVNMAVVDHLDAFTAPRLVEYHDPDPCDTPMVYAPGGGFAMLAMAGGARPRAYARRAHPSVTVEATYDVDEYDVSILSAKESDGLVGWLNDNGYRIPAGAEAVLGSYIKQNMRFFVAKVNLDRMKLIGKGYLRPLQVRYDTPKFMLPLRLGTVNANGAQDLLVYALTRKGRVETANYPTVKLPTGSDVPLFVKQEFGDFYKAMFDRAVEREHMRAVFTEYAWDVGTCDPCAAPPLSNQEMVALGARWADPASDTRSGWPLTPETFVTRLHVRYDAKTFPEDLTLIETADRTNFQGRYVLHHPWRGNASCEAGAKYRATLPARFEREAKNLAELTGWPLPEIKNRMAANGQSLRQR